MIFDDLYFYSDDDPHGIFELYISIPSDQDSDDFPIIPCNDPDLESYLAHLDEQDYE